MNTKSKNGFDLIKIGAGTVKGKFVKAFIATLIVFAPLIALCFIPYAGWAISVLLFGVYQTGYIRFFRKLINNENPSLSVLFSEFKTGWLETFLGACLIVMYILGGVLLLIPGIVLFGMFSMALFIAEEYKTKSVIETLKLTNNKMKGNVSSMFAYKSIFMAIYLVWLIVSLLSAWGVYALFISSPMLAVVLGIVAGLILLITFAVVTVYYHACNEAFFQESLADKKAEVIAETEEVKEEVKTEEVKVEKPKTTTRKTSTAKKTTTKKSEK